MALILDGTNGLSDVDGSAATPAIRGTDANTGIFFPAADTIAFSEGGVEVARFDSAGNFGVGVTPNGSYQLQAGSSSSAASRGFNLMAVAGGYSGGDYPSIGYNFRTTATSGSYTYNGSDVASNINFSTSINFNTAASGTAGNAITFAERMRINSNGVVGIGDTESSGNPRLRIRNNALSSTARTSNNLIALATNGNGADGCISITDSVAYNTWIGQNNGGAYVVCVVNGVRLPSGATAWVSDSDERFKDIIEPITDALNKVSTLRTVIGKYKTEEDARRSFLIAQDVQAVFPEAVYAQKDEDETLGVAYTDLIPLMIASIKELNAKVDAQATTVQEQQAMITELKATVDAQAAQIAALEAAP
jgi:hypothetical protein